MLIASFSWLSLSAQLTFQSGVNQGLPVLFGFDFSTNESSWFEAVASNPATHFYTPAQTIYQNPDATCLGCDFEAKFSITLNNVSEGQTIYIKNKTNGIPSKPWDIDWHNEYTCNNGTYLATNNFNQGQHLQLTVPIVGGTPFTSNSTDLIQHKLWLAVDYGSQGWGGLCTASQGCGTRRVLIYVNVLDIPDCIPDQTICSGQTFDINTLIPSNITVSNWLPFDPSTQSPNGNLNYNGTPFTVTLTDNINSLTTNCTFNIFVLEPEIDLLNISSLCAEDLPYSIPFSDIFTNEYEPIELNINGIQVYNAFDSYFNQDYFEDFVNQQEGYDFITITQAGTYSFDFVYQVYVDGVWIACSKTYELTIHKQPKIIIPQEISFCGQNFETICIPNPPLNYNFSWEHPFGAVYQSSSNPCFTPTQYGHYLLVVSNKFGCEYEYSFNVVEGLGPKIVLNDVEWCKELENAPTYLGFNNSLLNAVSYSWTYNGNPIAGQNSSQIPFTLLSDGTYCVTVTWDNDCESKACFEVYECCGEPDPAFTMSYQSNPLSISGSLTVQNDPNNTIAYSSEQFVLYQWCKGSGWIEVITSSILFTDFDTPYIFTYPFNFQCKYKVVHRVWSDCYNKSFIYEQVYEAVQPMPIIVYPNPALKGLPVNIKMTSYVDPAYVEITNLVTGERVFTGKLEFSNPLSIDYSVFTKSKGSSFGIYNVKVFNKTSVVNEKLIMR